MQKVDLQGLFKLPEVVAAKTMREKVLAVLRGFWDAMKEDHPLLSIVMKYDADFTRPQRLMIIFTATMSQMFVNALLYQLDSSAQVEIAIYRCIYIYIYIYGLRRARTFAFSRWHDIYIYLPSCGPDNIFHGVLWTKDDPDDPQETR